jgi:hypothetical protein
LAREHHGQLLARSLLAGKRTARSDRHPEAQTDIEDECSVYHMPITRYEATLRGKTGESLHIFPSTMKMRNTGKLPMAFPTRFVTKSRKIS